MGIGSELDRQIEVVSEAWAESVYYDNAEQWTHLFWDDGTDFRALFDRLDLTNVIELACGHGRHSEQITGRAGHIVMIDIFEQNLEFCRVRLAGHDNIELMKGDGQSFQPLPDRSASSIFCYDAMVHFSPDMVSAYLRDAARVMEAGGKALFHHSNYPAPIDRHYGNNPCARNHMTVELFANLAKEAGLDVIEQRVMRWGNHPDLDGLSLLTKP